MRNNNAFFEEIELKPTEHRRADSEPEKEWEAKLNRIQNQITRNESEKDIQMYEFETEMNRSNKKLGETQRNTSKTTRPI